MKIELTETERDVILAALRNYQDNPPSNAIRVIATNEGQHAPATDDEIDALCERLNRTTNGH